MKEIRTFLSSPQSFDLIEETKTKSQLDCKKSVKRKIGKRKTVSKKLLIKNILMEEDLSKLTERQKTLNKRFRNCIDKNKIDDISLINSGIDIIPYNINNTTVLNKMFKEKDVNRTNGTNRTEDGGDSEDKTERTNRTEDINKTEDINRTEDGVLETKIGVLKTRNSGLKEVTLNKKTLTNNKASTYLSTPVKKTKLSNQPLDKFYYNKLYEDSLSRNKPVSPRMSTIKLKNISDIYKIQLPLEKGNTKIRIKIKERNHIIRIRLGDPNIKIDDPQDRPCYPIQIYPKEESFLKILILYKKQMKIYAKKCLLISRLCFKSVLALGYTELERDDPKVIDDLSYELNDELKGKVGDEVSDELNGKVGDEVSDELKGKVGDEVIEKAESVVVDELENDLLKVDDVENDLNDEINNGLTENTNPVYSSSPHLFISQNCLMKISMYLEFMQISLKMHKCKFKRFLIEKLKITLERISNSKCICDIEEDIIKILIEVDQCKKCG